MDHDDAPWIGHRDELFDRVVRSGRARKRRRALAGTTAAVAVMLAVVGGLALPSNGTRNVRVTNPDREPTTTLPAPPARVLLIGDSIMLGARAKLEQVIPAAHVDAKVSRQLFHAIAVLDADRRAGLLPATVVVHLGNNGLSASSTFAEIMQAAGPDSTVYFLTVKLPRVWQDAVNGYLVRSAAKWPNAHILDWKQYSESHPDWFTVDGLHLSRAGQAAYAAFVGDGIGARTVRS